MDQELKEIRNKIMSYEKKIVDLIEERIMLGNEVAEIKYNYIKDSIDLSNKAQIYDSINRFIFSHLFFFRSIYRNYFV